MDFNKDPPAYTPMASAPEFPTTHQQQPINVYEDFGDCQAHQCIYFGNTIMTPPATTVTNVTVTGGAMYTGGCPVCHTGKFTGHFTCCGWLCCILLFPIGIICCLCMRKKRCNNCGFQPS